MNDSTNPPNLDTNQTATRLAKETGITEAEALSLVSWLRTDWSSLVRDAKIIKGRSDRR